MRINFPIDRRRSKRTISTMWSDDEIAEQEANEDYCAHCHERDRVECLEPVYVATSYWHCVEKMVHQECRDYFMRDNLPAVLESVRLSALVYGEEA